MKIGMVGGMGPESTADYYQQLIKLCYEKTNDGNYPEIIINSLNMTQELALVSARKWDELTQVLVDAVSMLELAGADFAFIASNTPHVVFDRVAKKSNIPLISILEATRKEASKLSLSKPGLLGTIFTMQSSFYQYVFDTGGISLIVPNEKEQNYIQEKLFTEIEHGIFLDETRKGLLRIVKRMIDEHSIDSVILGCTELPLILTQDAFGIHFLNTTTIHVNEIVEKYIELGKYNRHNI